MLLALSILTGFSQSLSIALIVLLGIEIVLLYFLTSEFFRRENFFVYAGFIFTIIWLVIFSLYSDQLEAIGIPANVLFMMLVSFAAVSVILAMVPLVMYATKAGNFGRLKKQYKSYCQQYEERNPSGQLSGNIGLVNKHDECTKDLFSVETDLRNVDQALNDVRTKYEIAKKSPELIFSPLDQTVQIKKPFVRPNINYVVVGLGGTGIDLMTELINHLDSAGAFSPGDINPYAFFAYDTNVHKLKDFLAKYEKTPSIAQVIHAKPELNNSLGESNILLNNPWITGEPVSIMSGTGNRRGIGAAAYNVIGQNLINFMIQEIDKLRQRSPQTSWVLIVLNSLGGGTGSGSFIKLTMDLLKDMNEKIQIRNPLSLWFGILPKNNEGDIYKVNAYAAIKELQFLFERSERLFGQSSDATAIHNPFDGCFLLSRESPSQKRDEELTDALVHFMTEIGFIPSGHTADVRLDINDIRTRLGLAANSFGTLNYYQVYFPASILSWYRNYAKPVLENNKKKLESLNRKADETLKKSEAAEIASANYVASVDKFNSDELMEFKQLRAYKKWTEEVQTWNDKLNSNVSSLKSEYDFEALKNKANTVRQTTMFKVQQNCYNIDALIENEKRKLTTPDISDVYKQVPIDDPETFDLSLLTDSNSTLRSLMDKSGKISLLQDYYKPLTFPLGDVGMPLANLDFDQMKRPINLGAKGTEFVEAYQPRIVGRDKYRNKIVESPRIKSVILLASSCLDNLSSPFPTIDEIKGNLVSSAEEEGNAEVSFNKVPAKRFTVSAYWLLAGLHIWKLLPDEPPVLKDLAFLSDAYERVSTGRREDMLDLFRNHTLFYNDSSVLDTIIGQPTKKDFVSKRNRTTEFWVRYNPSDVSVGIWGTILLATIYDSVETYGETLSTFDQALSPVSNISQISELDFKGLKNAYDELIDCIHQKLTPELNVLADSYTTLEGGKGDIAESLNKVIEQLSVVQNESDLILSKIDAYKKRFAQLKADDLLSKRNQNQSVMMLNDLQKILKALNINIKSIVSGRGMVT